MSVLYPYMTDTDFEANTEKEPQTAWPQGGKGEGGEHKLPPLDTAEYAAGKVLEAIRTEAAEVYAHEWMKKQW